jgi:hypothetical protein
VHRRAQVNVTEPWDLNAILNRNRHLTGFPEARALLNGMRQPLRIRYATNADRRRECPSLVEGQSVRQRLPLVNLHCISTTRCGFSNFMSTRDRLNCDDSSVLTSKAVSYGEVLNCANTTCLT